MYGLLPLFYVLCAAASLSLAQNYQDDFFQSCPKVTCGFGSESIQIRFPFRLRSAPISCGLSGFELTCSGNETRLSRSSFHPFRITAINYLEGYVTVHIGSLFSSCPLRNLSSLDFLSADPIYRPITQSARLINCTEKTTPGYDLYSVGGPVSCLSGSGHFVYVVSPHEPMDRIPSSCVVAKNGEEIPWASYGYVDPAEMVKNYLKEKVKMTWNLPENIVDCRKCERQRKLCGFRWEKNQTFCQRSTRHGLRVALITGASITGFLLIATVTLTLLYISRRSARGRETRVKVEMFLASYKADKPTRYNYSGIKKITKRFSHKLGQGGFGSVYKGELPNGIPVAVKMLEGSAGGEREFINEVAAMGGIHHVNVVRLLGFCSQGSTHALVYEFMPKGSLEKFIFIDKDRGNVKPFIMEKLQDIAVGIAKGIEYLHQGCDQRILHFDIKPHNILLDDSFNPKISDFGLAKLCPRDYSMVTMTAARGTMGYIAPEIYSRNFGAVSYKSDVYSFGILLLEMVSGRRTVDPEIKDRDEVYFPEWVYNRMAQGDDLGLAMDKEAEDIVKKLVIVALWCIQWNPADRPTMTRVVQLLMGGLESLQIPLKPFVSSSGQVGGVSNSE